MALNFTLPGFGGSSKKTPAADPDPKKMVKTRYWTPDTGDYEAGVQYGTQHIAGDGSRGNPYGQTSELYPGGSGYTKGDPFYEGKVWDKRKQTWVKVSDDIYRKNSEGDILMWQPPSTPAKKGLMK
jgi:hypothetical protein